MASFSEVLTKAKQINSYVVGNIQPAITRKEPNEEKLDKIGITWGESTDLQYYADAIDAIDKDTAEIPTGSKFAYSTWNQIPNIIEEFVQKTSTECVNIFSNCYNIEYVGSSGNYFIVNKNSIESMFQNCSALKEVHIGGSSDWFYGMKAFQGCSSLHTVDFQYQPKTPEDISSMFEGCLALTSIVPMKLTNSIGVKCNSLYKNTGIINAVGEAFAGTDTTIISADEMFQDCPIPSIGDVYIPMCKSCRAMFYVSSIASGKSKLQTVGNLTTQNCTNMNNMFANQTELTSIQSIDMLSCSTAEGMFTNCNKLNRLVIKNLGGTAVYLDLSDLTSWEVGLDETVAGAVNKAETGFTLKLSPTVKNRLSQGQISSLEAKGFNIVT